MVTVALWRLAGDERWHHGQITYPRAWKNEYADPDGLGWLFAQLDDRSESDPVGAGDGGSSAAGSDAGVLRAELDDLAELVVAETLPCITKCGVESEKRLTVGPQPANVHPSGVHEFSITPLSRRGFLLSMDRAIAAPHILQ